MASSARILIVEDKPEQLVTLKNGLSNRYEVLCALSLEQARSFLDNELDIVVSDIRLDENDRDNRDGIILLNEVKQKYPQLPVILVTAYGGVKVETEALKLGAFDFISKPINLDELNSVIERALKGGPKRRPLEDAKRLIADWTPPFLFFIFAVLMWEGIVEFFKVPNYLVPPPHMILGEIFNSFAPLIRDTGITLLESVLGFILANIAGILVAIGFAHSRFMERSIYPYTIALKAVPLVAIAPLLVLWFGNGILGKVVMAALIAFFPIVVNATVGLKAIDNEALDLMKSLSATRLQILFKLRFPTALPYIFSALKISSTLSVVGAIVAELAGADKGIGYTILMASYKLETNMLFSALVAASIGGIAFFGFISLIEKKLLFWHESASVF